MDVKRLGCCGLVLAGLFVGLSPAAGGTGRVRASACRVGQLAISPGPEISEKTGQHSLTIRLTNRGSAPCLLDGYPAIAFTDARGVLPFRISHRGDLMIARRAPKPLTVRGGGRAYVIVNKYRCDVGDHRRARGLVLRLPNAAPATRLVLRIPAGYDLAYCGNGDPGSTLSVSPFVPTVRAALR